MTLMAIPLPPAGWPEAAALPRPPMPLPPPELIRRPGIVPALLGHQYPAGLGASSVLPDLDFETFSEAGFIWNETTQKWGLPAGAPTTAKKGLPTITLQPYAEHPSTEVLCLAYDLKDGRGRRHWKPGMAPPADLLAHVVAGGLMAAWNSMFEYRIWNHVCTRDFGWPALALEQMRCDAAKSRAYSLPGALAAAGQVLRLANQKDADGDRLIKKFSMPRTPTKADARRRIRPEDDPEDAARLYAYNERDIVTEAEASARIPDLDATELQYWMLDQRINARGVQLDMPSVHNCASVVRQVLVQYNAELCELTGKLVSRVSEIQRLSNWLGTQGVIVSSLDAESVAEALTRPGLPAPARRALEIRELAGSAAVKKVFAMTYTVSKSGRVHDLFTYHGARTGRVVGSGCQPTNLPKSGPRVLRCASCRSYFGAEAKAAGCPWCACPQPPGVKPREWSHEATEHALAALNTGSLQVVEQFFGDAMLTVSGVLRGLFCAAPGHDLICADYSAIEAVVLAMIAGEQWRIDVFRSHAKIYEMSAAKITGIPFEDFMKHAGYTDAELAAPDWFMREPGTPGAHHPMRGKIGKVAELACFSPDTLVLTKRGYVAIVDVLFTDKLWDGIEWVSHAGVISKGLRQVIGLDGVRMTPNHPVSTGHSWKAAKKLASCENTLSRCLANGSANLPSNAWSSATAAASPSSGCVAAAAPTRTKSTAAIYDAVKALAAMFAPKSKRLRASKSTGLTRTSCPTSNTAVDCLTGLPRQSADVISRTLGATKTMARAAFKWIRFGDRTDASFYATPLLLPGGTTLISTWTGSTLTAGMSPGTFDSSPASKTSSINAPSKKCSAESQSWSPVYDIVNAGPRHRFTIKTDSGHLIVHNSGFQGWVGAWKAFGADAFLSDEEMKDGILAWRDASPAIVEFWGGQFRGRGYSRRPELYGVEGMFIAALMDPGETFEFRGFKFRYDQARDVLFLTLLSGRHMAYHRPRTEPNVERGGLSIYYEGWNTNPKNGPPGWIQIYTWGGRLTENIVQAVSRDIQWHGMLALEAAGYPIVLHVYDEDTAEVPEGFGSVEEFQQIMERMPTWAHDWPIRARGGWRGKRFRK